MVENRKRSGKESADAGGGGASRVARWILHVLLGERLELAIGSRRFRLTQERAFRLEDVDGGFVFFMGSSAALERRLTVLAGGRLRAIRASESMTRRENSVN